MKSLFFCCMITWISGNGCIRFPAMCAVLVLCACAELSGFKLNNIIHNNDGFQAFLLNTSLFKNLSANYTLLGEILKNNSNVVLLVMEGPHVSYNPTYINSTGPNYHVNGQNSSLSLGYGPTYGTTEAIAYGPTIGPTYGPSYGATYGATYGPSYGATIGHTFGPSFGATFGGTYGPSFGATYGNTIGPMFGATYGPTIGPSFGETYGNTYGPSYGASYSLPQPVPPGGQVTKTVTAVNSLAPPQTGQASQTASTSVRQTAITSSSGQPQFSASPRFLDNFY